MVDKEIGEYDYGLRREFVNKELGGAEGLSDPDIYDPWLYAIALGTPEIEKLVQTKGRIFTTPVV